MFDPDEHFASFGFDVSLVDLRRYFGRTVALRRMLMRHQVVWALGGNSFLLRRAMRDSGFEHIVRDLLDAGIVYAGCSAGACVAGDDLRAVGVMDEPHASAPGHADGEPIWRGLGLLPFTVLPHYQSDHPEAAAALEAASWANERRIDFRTLRDGEVLIVQNGGAPAILPRGAQTHPTIDNA